ncbi:MAG: hypothetical protein P4L51_04505 [Puia sp.]|nr:hypothetical protein [Puia sp.]
MADRIRAAAEGLIDAFIDTYGNGYIELSIGLGVFYKHRRYPLFFSVLLLHFCFELIRFLQPMLLAPGQFSASQGFERAPSPLKSSAQFIDRIYTVPPPVPTIFPSLRLVFLLVFELFLEKISRFGSILVLAREVTPSQSRKPELVRGLKLSYPNYTD